MPKWGQQHEPHSFSSGLDATMDLVLEWLPRPEEREPLLAGLSRWIEGMEATCGDAPDFWQWRTNGTLVGPLQNLDPALVVRYPAELLADACSNPRGPARVAHIEALGRLHLSSRTLLSDPGSDPDLIRRWMSDRFNFVMPLTRLTGTEPGMFEKVKSLDELCADLRRIRSVRIASRPRLVPLLGVALADFGLRLITVTERDQPSGAQGGGRVPERKRGDMSDVRRAAQRHLDRFQLLLRLVDLGTLVPEKRAAALDSDRSALGRHARALFSEMRKDPMAYASSVGKWLGHGSPESTLVVTEWGAAGAPVR